jgi:hypothetical protein
MYRCRVVIALVAAILAVAPASLSNAATRWGSEALLTQPPQQNPDVGPPPLGAVVFEVPMTSGMPRLESPSGLIIGEHVGEGFIVKVRGPLYPGGPASMFVHFVGPVIQDGEVRVEAKVVNGVERAFFFLLARTSPYRDETGKESRGAYAGGFHPGTQNVMLYRMGDPMATLATHEPAGPVGQLRPDDWNAFALRMQGHRLWVLVNDEPVLTSEDERWDRGGVSILVSRYGVATDDPREVAVVFRNLRISELADQEP